MTYIPSSDDGLDADPYAVGPPAGRYDPAQERYRHMLHLVAYDIRNPKRLRRVARVCEDYGIRVEYSVFECDLENSVFTRFWNELSREIEPDEDTILAYRICGSCVERITSLGVSMRPERKLLYML